MKLDRGAEGKMFHAEDWTSTELNNELSEEVLDTLTTLEKESKFNIFVLISFFN